MDSNEPIQLGKRCTCRAKTGKDGILREAVCVDVAIVPSGNVTETGCLAC